MPAVCEQLKQLLEAQKKVTVKLINRYKTMKQPSSADEALALTFIKLIESVDEQKKF